jgi:hypothetical protein
LQKKAGAGEGIKVSEKAGQPDVALIVEQSRAHLASGLVTRPVALKALHQIREGLRREFKFSDDDLNLLAELIADLEPESPQPTWGSHPGGL